MAESHRIRLAQFADAAEIARLNIELGYSASAEEIGARLRFMLASADFVVAVAAGHDSQLLGWTVAERRLSLESGEKAEITGLVVGATARRTGVGTALVAAAEQWAAKQGLKAICVRSNITRTESHPFYQSQGYVRKKTQHTYEKQLASV
jgi:GNAT superfamily N-acetyltransferase